MLAGLQGRNPGSGLGRVLAGMQAPLEDQCVFRALLDKIGYAYFDDSQHSAYHLSVSAAPRGPVGEAYSAEQHENVDRKPRAPPSGRAM